MDSSETDTKELVLLAGRGDPAATQALFARHRDQLKRMVSVRIDPRLAARFDESDIVQDALIEASRRLEDYARSPDRPFYPWLRRLAWERMIQLHRHHLDRQKRSALREHEDLRLSDRSAIRLVERLIGSDTDPQVRMIQREQLQRARECLDELPDKYREVLVLRHLEQLSVEETANVLCVSEGTVKSRHFRAIERLHQKLGLS